MRRVPRVWLVLLALAAAAAVGALGSDGARAGGSADWPGYLFDTSHSSYNAAATSISPATVPSVEPVWRWLAPAPVNGGTGALSASPTVVDGVVYIGDGDGRFDAIRESDRTVLWSRYLGVEPASTCESNAGIFSSPTVETENGVLTVYENAPDGNMYALNAATGAVIWKTSFDPQSPNQNDFFAWGSPLVANGKVYVGISSECDQPLVVAGVTAFDQATGARIATWNSMLDGAIGGSVWSTPVVLPDGSIVVTTGNGEGSDQSAWAEAIVKLSGSSLAFEDGWQIPPSQAGGDADFGASATAFTAVIGGVSTPMVGACNKNGFYYAFRQSDLHDGPVWEDQVAQPRASGAGQCLAAANWDGSHLLVSGGDPTSIGGTTYDGSIRSVNPATGAVLWQTGLPGGVVGSASEDGAGVVAAPIYSSSTKAWGVVLVRASDGAILGSLPAPGPIFSQPVFAGGDLLMAGTPPIGLTAYAATTSGPSPTVSPSSIPPGQTHTITITGSGFSGTPSVFFSGPNDVSATSVHLVSSTQLTVSVHVTGLASHTPRDVVVIEPGPVADVCAGCLSILPATSTAVASSANPSTSGSPVTFTATVSSSDGGGTVAFTADGATIPGCGAVPLTPTAACTTSSLSTGTHTVTALYSGDAASASSSSLLSGGQVVQAPPPPPPPANLTAQISSTTAIKLTWDAEPGVTKFILYKGTQTGGPYTQAAVVVPPTTTRTLSGLTPGTHYYFVAVANSPTGNSLPSTEADATTPAIPDAPTLTATVVSLTSVSLTWPAVPGATKYFLYRNGSQFATVTGTSRTVVNLTSGATYDFTAKATNGWATSAASSTAEVTMPVTPAAPADLHATVTRTTQVGLAWDAVSGATKYLVFEATSPGGPYTELAAPTATAKTVTGLTPGATYYFVVKAANQYATSPASTRLTVTTP